MSAARDEVLRRIRAALRDVPPGERPADVAVARDYDRSTTPEPSGVLERFAERVRDYHAELVRVDPSEIKDAVTRACAERGLHRVAIPRELPAEWRPDGVEVIEDEGLTAQQLDRIDAALTGCAVAIAETGTIVLDARGTSGRRVLTLVPDHHLCVVKAEQVVANVPEAVAALEASVAVEKTPVTLVSGPSASSDIELNRVEGVHGPRHLLVFLAQGPATE